MPTIVLGAVLAAAALAVTARGPGRLSAEVVQAAAALVAPLGALTLTTAHALTGGPDAVGLALLLVVLGGVAAATAGHTGRSTTVDVRRALEVSGWAVVLTGLLVAAPQGTGIEALALLLAALTAAACAPRADRRAEWWVALGLLVAASWVTLGARGVGVPEAYLAPLGAALAVVDALRWRRGGAHAAELLGAGMALALAPTAVIDDPLLLGPDHLDRTVLATTAAALLVAAGLLVVRRRRPAADARPGIDPVLSIAAVAAALAALGLGRRAVVLATQSWTGADVPSVELLALPAAALLAGAAAVWLGARPGPDPVRRLAPWVVLLVATVPVVLTRDDGPAGLAWIVVVAGLGTLLAARGACGLLGLPGGRGAGGSPIPPDLIGQGAALLAASTVAALSRSWPVPDDAVIAALGVLLLVVGGVRMRAFPQTPTWTALGPGLVAALAAPTLAALATGTGWRVGVAIVGGLLAVGVGAARRWQAPFAVGAVVLLVELVVQLAPVTREAIGVLGWWPVLAIGGAALLGLGLSYERRLRDAQEAVRYVGHMR